MFSGKNIFISRLSRPAGRSKRYFHGWGRSRKWQLFGERTLSVKAYGFASSPEGGAFWHLPVSRAKPPPFGGGGFAKQRRRGFTKQKLSRSAALSQKAALHLPFSSTTPPRENGIAERPQALRYPENIKFSSAIYAQSNAERI